ncbi:hypothetical protein CRUP_011571, partial [Coryphaenoides rupestris]
MDQTVAPENTPPPPGTTEAVWPENSPSPPPPVSGRDENIILNGSPVGTLTEKEEKKEKKEEEEERGQHRRA